MPIRSSPGCVPYNIFGDGVRNQAAADWVNMDSVSHTTVTQQVVSGSSVRRFRLIPAAAGRFDRLRRRRGVPQGRKRFGSRAGNRGWPDLVGADYPLGRKLRRHGSVRRGESPDPHGRAGRPSTVGRRRGAPVGLQHRGFDQRLEAGCRVRAGGVLHLPRHLCAGGARAQYLGAVLAREHHLSFHHRSLRHQRAEQRHWLSRGELRGAADRTGHRPGHVPAVG